MLNIDIAIVKFVNGFEGRYPFFDFIVMDVFQLTTFKLLPLTSLLIWLWFRPSAEEKYRPILFAGFLSAFVTLVITRAVQNLGPHRPRPALEGSFHFTIPSGGMPNDWSSFPSDTSGLAFALAFTIWLCSRRLGLLAFFWAAVVVSFPRLYGGYHYPSDLIAGAAIGMACTALIARVPIVTRTLFNRARTIELQRPAVFYLVAFFLMFQTSDYFSDFRRAGSQLLAEMHLK